MLFHAPRKPVDENNFRILIKGIEMTKVAESKLVGCISDKNLTWKPHINFIMICGELRKLLFLIRKTKHLMPMPI